MSAEQSARPAKRTKIAHDGTARKVQQQTQTRSAYKSQNQQPADDVKYVGNKASKQIPDDSQKQSRAGMFSQPSVMMSGDKGIFVTCDKGKEKKCLIELGDLIEEWLKINVPVPVLMRERDIIIDDKAVSSDSTTDIGRKGPIDSWEKKEDDEDESDIETSIQAELAEMGAATHQSAQGDKQPSLKANVVTTIPKRAFQLITLDIPCVSFVRFHPQHPSYSDINPTVLVHSLCNAAAKTHQARSRFIKRMSPISHLAKVLNGGLEKCCEQVLPPVFGTGIGQAHGQMSSPAGRTGRPKSEIVQADAATEADTDTVVQDWPTFAIRPTIRNNDKLSRDEVIQHVASEVTRLGQGRHKVDLNGYEKGILVEVYRGWVGMSIVNNYSKEKTNGAANDGIGTMGQGGAESHRGEATSDAIRKGYEALKRFNLAEIYTQTLAS